MKHGQAEPKMTCSLLKHLFEVFRSTLDPLFYYGVKSTSVGVFERIACFPQGLM